MSPFAIFAALCLVVAQFALPRRIAFVPLLIAACHFGNIELAANLSITRMLILAGLIRAFMAGKLEWSPRQPLDVLFAVFGAFTLLSSVAHTGGTSNAFVFRAGLVFNICGTYLYARAFLRDGLEVYARWLVIALIPLAILLAVEQRTGRNAYVSLGARHEQPTERGGRLRAQGPFSHAILAGTAGASSIPLMLILWRRRKRLAQVGIAASFLVTVASASSGPLATLMIGLGALYLWRWRKHLRAIRWATIIGLAFLSLVMSRPVWHLMSGIDLVGGSTGWHRARLIDGAVNNLDEWWLAGTDYTRHWMPTGVTWNGDHTDLTNYYIHLGVIGGLPLVICLVAIILKSFSALGRCIRRKALPDDSVRFVCWCAGSALFAHCITFLTISYFDQTLVLFYLIVGAIPGLTAVKSKAPSKTEPELGPQPDHNTTPLPVA